MKNAVGAVQSVVLLGGTSEIGQAVVRRLIDGRRGVRVVLGARRPAECSPFVDELTRSGSLVECVEFDACRPEDHGALFDVISARGDLDVVVTAWGVLGKTQAELDEDPLAASLVADTNYTGVVSAGLQAARVMRRQGHGTIIHLSSVAGERVRKANFVYGSSKAGSDAFMQGLADSLADTAIRVLIVRPGFVKSKMTAGMKAAPFSTTPEAVAEGTITALRGTSDVAWVPGLLRVVFVVFRHLPRVVWRRLPE
jgi:decaprenylphospho-beta-D-erythro-pentofuranosid-2-ulose 2-reductase